MSNLPPTPVLNYAQPVRDDLRPIAVRQCAIMLCILAYFVLIITQFVVPPSLAMVLMIAGIGISITAAIFVFMLALAIYSTGTGIVMGILTLIPIVGLIVLLVINSQATKILRAHGIAVGLLGANPSQIPAPGTTSSR